MTMPHVPNPEDLEAARPLLNIIGATWKWLAGLATGLGLGGVWIWRASKAHSGFEDLQGRVKILEENQDQYVTLGELEHRQALCKVQIAAALGDKLHEMSDEMRDEMSAANANICRIMDKMGLEPVKPKERHRRRSDV